MENYLSRQDLKMIGNYELARKGLVIELMTAERCAAAPEEFLYRTVEDLALVCKLQLGQRSADEYRTALLSRNAPEHYNISADTLFADALANSAVIRPVDVRPLRSVMEEIVGHGIFIDPEGDENVHLYCVGNSIGFKGSAALFYPGVMQQCAVIAGGSFYALPSSVHEFLMIPEDEVPCAEILNEMVSEVNRTVVCPADRLTDHVYRYDVGTGLFCSV